MDLTCVSPASTAVALEFPGLDEILVSFRGGGFLCLCAVDAQHGPLLSLGKPILKMHQKIHRVTNYMETKLSK